MTLCGIGHWCLSVLWLVCVFNNVVLCGTRYPAGINIGSRVETVTDTGRGRSATNSEDEEEDSGSRSLEWS